MVGTGTVVVGVAGELVVGELLDPLEPAAGDVVVVDLAGAGSVVVVVAPACGVVVGSVK